MRRTGRATALVAGLVVVAAACSRPQPDRDPSATALALFRLAHDRKDSPEALADVVATHGAAEGSGRLRAALRGLAGATGARVIGLEPLDGEHRVAVDVEASLAGEGTALYSVQVERFEPAGWRVTAFSGPGVGWPDRPDGTGEGLTSSSPPR